MTSAPVDEKTAPPILGSEDQASRLLQELCRGLDQARGAASRLTGPFAMAVHDARTRRSFGAVDRFAIGELCWRVQGDALEFGANATQLATPSAELDAQAVFDYLFFHCIPSPRTIYRGVQRVPAAHAVTMEGGQVTLLPYWAPSFGTSATHRSARPTFDALRDQFRALLREAVRRHLGAGQPACFLSGGTDSSTIAGVIREVTGQAPLTYSIGFDAEGYDEMAYARIAARHFDCVHHEYYITPDDLVSSIPKVAASFDQPFGNSSVLPSYYCALRAKEDGVQHLLAGDGGDELFGGNARYAKQRVFGLYEAVPLGVRKHLIGPLLGSEGIRRLPLARKAASYVEQARVPMPDRLQMYNLLVRLGVDEVLTPQFLERVDTNEPARHQRDTWAWAGEASDLNRTLAFDWRYTLGESDIPKVRGAARLAGVGVAFPLLDDELLAFSMSLPDNYKLRGLKLRWFFKEALHGFLPPEIIAKTKHGFGLPFGPWLLKHSGLHKLAADSLGSLGDRGIVRPTFMKALLEHRLAEHPGYYGEMIWILMMLEQWFRAHPHVRFGL